MKKVAKLIVLLCITVLLTIAIIVLSLFLLYIFYKFSQNTERTNSKTQNYKFTEVSPFRELNNHGFITLSQSLDREGYITYLNEFTGSSIIITHLGGESYECTGSCVCNEQERRIAFSGRVLTRSLMVLFSAFSVTMAMDIARDTFEEQCVDQYSDVCDSRNIQSNVGMCTRSTKKKAKREAEAKKKEEGGGGEEAAEEDDEEDEVENDDVLHKSFVCEGYCLTALEALGAASSFPENIQKIAEEKIGKCEDLKFVRVVRLAVEDVENSKSPMFPDETEGETMQRRFARVELADFCEESSKLVQEWFSEEDEYVGRSVCFGHEQNKVPEGKNADCFEIPNLSDVSV